MPKILPQNDSTIHPITPTRTHSTPYSATATNAAAAPPNTILEPAVIRGNPPVLLIVCWAADDLEVCAAVLPESSVVAVPEPPVPVVEASVADADGPGPSVMVTGNCEISPGPRVVVRPGRDNEPVVGIFSVQTAVVVPPTEHMTVP